ncbi:MAG: hypothetical protein AAGF46_08265 [Pseudomonadota bacterium]
MSTQDFKQHESSYFGGSGHRWFTIVKYSTYLLLMVNAGLFLQEELRALEHTYADGVSAGQWIQVFSATVDTVAWIVLLLLFELETSIISDERITGWVKFTLHWVRILCYGFIAYAFYGYCQELAVFFTVVPLPMNDLCALVGQDWSVLLKFDEYAVITSENCSAYGDNLFRFGELDIAGNGTAFNSALWLAWTDVINAGTWILVVLLLEVEVRLQLRGNLSDRIMAYTKVLKFALYGTLFLCAGYWGVAGNFLDFWDAALWLFAFIFIELNVFEWQHETSTASEPAAIV